MLRSGPRVQALAARGDEDRALTADAVRGQPGIPRSTSATRCARARRLRLHSEVRHFPEPTAPEVTALGISRRAERRSRGARHTGAAAAARAHLDAHRMTQAILPAKDVDGFNWENLGALIAGQRACSSRARPEGVIGAARSGGRDGGRESRAVIVGRSNIVGKPLALMLVNRGAPRSRSATPGPLISRAARARRTSSSPRRVARGSSPPPWSSPALPSSTSGSIGDAGGQARRRRGFRGRARRGGLDHAGSRRRGAHDRGDADRQHGAGRGRAAGLAALNPLAVKRIREVEQHLRRQVAAKSHVAHQGGEHDQHQPHQDAPGLGHRDSLPPPIPASRRRIPLPGTTGISK